jgi:hypothetical protein
MTCQWPGGPDGLIEPGSDKVAGGARGPGPGAAARRRRGLRGAASQAAGGPDPAEATQT